MSISSHASSATDKTTTAMIAASKGSFGARLFMAAVQPRCRRRCCCRGRGRGERCPGRAGAPGAQFVIEMGHRVAAAEVPLHFAQAVGLHGVAPVDEAKQVLQLD